MICAAAIIKLQATDCEHELTYYAAVSATCTENGNVEYWHCEKCDKDFADEATTTELETTATAATGHTWDDGVTTGGSCTETGTITYTCTVCGETKTEDTEATGHSYDSQGTCTVCGAVAEGMNAWASSTVNYYVYNGVTISDHVIYYLASDGSCYYIENGERVYICTAEDITNGLTAITIFGNTVDDDYSQALCTADDGSQFVLSNVVSV